MERVKSGLKKNILVMRYNQLLEKLVSMFSGISHNSFVSGIKNHQAKGSVFSV